VALAIHPPTSAKVKRVELYLHSPSGPSRPVIGRILPCLHFYPSSFNQEKSTACSFKQYASQFSLNETGII